MKLAVVILAAGQGTRMKSTLPKVLHRVAGKPIIQYSIDAAQAVTSDEIVIVVGYAADRVKHAIGDGARFVEQTEQLGTGHAVLQARSILAGRTDAVLVTYGDMPLLRGETLKRLVDRHANSDAVITMLTVISQDTMNFGRITRDPDGRVIGIVEESEATPEELAIHELNCGVYCFDANWLWEHLTLLKPTGRKGEYYLTDLVAIAVGEQRKIDAITIEPVAEVVGINTRTQLAGAEREMRRRINSQLMDGGVTFIDPETTYVDAGVHIGTDTIVHPNTHITGTTQIASNCSIGPNSIVRDAIIGQHCEIIASVVRDSRLGQRVHVGPFADLRPGAVLDDDVYVGNHAEIKNSHLGIGVHVGHFSYIGDSEIGARTNIGAGTITCNYDGKAKHRTVIGQDAFIGSDTLLRAPVSVGDRSTTGAGSVVTKNVPADATAVGAPARVMRKGKA